MKTLIAFAFSAVLLLAQTTPPAPPSPDQIAAQRVARLTTLLTLTAGQQSIATTIFTTEATAVSGLFSVEQSARTALETAVEANDTAGIASAAAQLGTLDSRQIQAHASADAAFFAVLTADQQTKYRELIAQGPGGRGPGPAGIAGFGARARPGR
jgi:Spy/CpxP family protein refolding chaperone